MGAGGCDAPGHPTRWLAAAESGTGALLGASFGPYTVGEQTLARDLLPALGPGMLVLADRNFLSHTLARDVLATGAHILWRASASFTLTPTRVLADGMYLAELHPARKADGPPIIVRVIEYTVHTSPANGGGEEQTSEVFTLVTDLLDPEAYPALDLACAYPMRWQSETVIGHHKTDMGEGMPVLRSKDPEGVAQEMWALFAVYQAIHTLIGAAVDATGIPPEKISFPHALAAATDSV
ncbi:MAG: transposase, partial [Gemmatimonadales bacterium]